MNEPVENTDKEIWREIADDYYAPSIFVTAQNSIGIKVGGYVYIKTVEEWHKQADRIEELESLLEDCYKIQKMQAEEVYKGNAKIEEMEKIIREGIQAFGAIQEQQLKDKFEKPQTNPVNWVYDNGKWSAKVDKKIFVESDDFTHDVRLYIDGDFEDDLQKLAYAKEIAKRLNVTSQTIWCDCGDAITKDSGAKCGVCARETK